MQKRNSGTPQQDDLHRVTPEDSSKTAKTNISPVTRRRSDALKEFWEKMRNADTLHCLRGTHANDVLAGETTFGDLFRVGCSLNEKKASSIASNFSELNSHVSVEERERKFPIQQLCEHIGITEQQYRKIDKYGYRRDIFYALLSIFEDTQGDDNNMNFQVPHVLLLEELTTTLNGGIFSFPYVQLAQSANMSSEDMYDEELRPHRTQTTHSKVDVTCTSPNKITVTATAALPNWLGICFETRLSYDVAVIDDKSISYHNANVTVILEGADAKRFDAAYREFCRDHTKSYNPQQAPPTIFPEKEGLILYTPLKAAAFTTQSMLFPCPEKVTLAEEEPIKSVTTKEETSIKARIRNFFSVIFSGMKSIFVAIMNLFCTRTTGKEKDKASKYGHTSDAMLETASENHAKEQIRTKDAQTQPKPHLTNHVATHIPGETKPGMKAYSVTVRPVITETSKSP